MKTKTFFIAALILCLVLLTTKTIYIRSKINAYNDPNTKMMLYTSISGYVEETGFVPTNLRMFNVAVNNSYSEEYIDEVLGHLQLEIQIDTVSDKLLIADRGFSWIKNDELKKSDNITLKNGYLFFGKVVLLEEPLTSPLFYNNLSKTIYYSKTETLKSDKLYSEISSKIEPIWKDYHNLYLDSLSKIDLMVASPLNRKVVILFNREETGYKVLFSEVDTIINYNELLGKIKEIIFSYPEIYKSVFLINLPTIIEEESIK